MEIKIIPSVIIAVLFVLFIVPFFKGVVCLGNCAGATISAIMLMVFVFWNRFCSFIGGLWEHRFGKIIVTAAGVIAAGCAIIAVVISVCMIKAANSPPKNENITMIVLGCQVKNGGPSLMLKKRLDTAYSYLSEHESVKVIVSGGKGEDEAISEAQCMRDYLTSKGISPDRIIMEDKSTNTYENLSFSNEIIKREGLPHRVCLVTDGYHQLRAQMIAERQKIVTDSISCKTSWWLVPTYWVREWFGVSYYKVFG